MAGDAAATRAAILRAAISEFSAYGYRGGRVERIAQLAPANKRMIYVYFGDKEQLFSAALHAVLSRVSDAVPITEDDLPGYAVRLFDHLQAHPEAARLSTWRQLERPDLGPSEETLYREKAEGISDRYGDSGLTPVDLLVLLQGMAAARTITPIELLRALGDDPAAPSSAARFRGALHQAAEAVVSRTSRG